MNAIINDGVLVHLDVSIWTGKARLMRSDVPQAADKLPSEELISLGSKKIFDPEKLRAFGTLKSRAVRTCESYGSRLMGGYLVNAAYLPDLETALSGIQQEWLTAVRRLVSAYDVLAEDWLKEHKEWATMLRQNMPTAAELTRKYNFSWQTYKIEPVTADAGYAGNTTEAEIQAMPDKVLAEIAEECQSIYNISFASGRATRRAFNAIDKLAGRCEALSFTSPYAAQMSTTLRSVVSSENLELAAFTLQAMSDAGKLQANLDMMQKNNMSLNDWMLCTPDGHVAGVVTIYDEPEDKSPGEIVAEAPVDYVEIVDTSREKAILDALAVSVERINTVDTSREKAILDALAVSVERINKVEEHPDSLVMEAMDALASSAPVQEEPEPSVSGTVDSLGLW